MGHYNSFIVRIWSGEQGRLRGHIEHVATRDKLIFLDPDAITEFIREHVGPTVDATGADQEAPTHQPNSPNDVERGVEPLHT